MFNKNNNGKNCFRGEIMNLKQLLCIGLTFGILILGIFLVPAQASSSDLSSSSFLRIHIRANSNEEIDQQVKYIVKDEVVDYLTPLLANADSKSRAMDIVNQNLSEISQIASLVLDREGYNYDAKAKLTSEYFPLRCYDNVVLESGEYDSLILELGTGTGNNWWCVVYPPLCFVATNPDNSKDITYRSKILDIINNFFGR